MRTREIPPGSKYTRIRDALQIHCSLGTCLREIDREFREFCAAGHVRMHYLGTAREKRDIDVFESFRRYDLRDLNFTGEFLQQTGVLLSLKKGKLSHGKAALFQHFAQLFSQDRKSVV